MGVSTNGGSYNNDAPEESRASKTSAPVFEITRGEIAAANVRLDTIARQHAKIALENSITS